MSRVTGGDTGLRSTGRSCWWSMLWGRGAGRHTGGSGDEAGRFVPADPAAILSGVMPESRPGAVLPRLGAYVALTKPRIIELLLVTTLPTMVVAARGLPGVWLMVATL